jgi:hypothetical protein
MGNNISNHNIIEPTSCLICWDNIEDNTWCKCIKCNIMLHDSCEETYRIIKNIEYTECPHCRRKGCIGSYIRL